MDRVNHSKKIGQVHYLHIPALERTKIPDETNHTPMFRMMTIAVGGNVTVDTYAVGNRYPLKNTPILFRFCWMTGKYHDVKKRVAAGILLRNRKNAERTGYAGIRRTIARAWSTPPAPQCIKALDACPAPRNV